MLKLRKSIIALVRFEHYFTVLKSSMIVYLVQNRQTVSRNYNYKINNKNAEKVPYIYEKMRRGGREEKKR